MNVPASRSGGERSRKGSEDIRRPNEAPVRLRPALASAGSIGASAPVASMRGTSSTAGEARRVGAPPAPVPSLARSAGSDTAGAV